jgi:hypothetical protein
MDVNHLVLKRAIIKRISKLWGVAPYRIDVEIGSTLGVSLDGVPPSQVLVDTLERDITELTDRALARMN